MYYTNNIAYGKSTASYGSTSYETTGAGSRVSYSVNTKAMCGRGCVPCIGCKFM